jgi:hypothetical protein
MIVTERDTTARPRAHIDAARDRPLSSFVQARRAAADVGGMRSLVLALGLLPCLAVGSLGCHVGDTATDPGEEFVVRAYTLEDGDTVWVEALVEDDMVLRRQVMAIDDGLTVEELIDELAMGEEYELVLDSTYEVLIIEVDEDPVAWIWPD